MRFHIVLIALSMLIWAVAAANAGHLSAKEAVPVATDDALDTTSTTSSSADAPAALDATVPDTASSPAQETIAPEIVNGGPVLPAPLGPKTPAEDTADSVLSCMSSCPAGNAACQNDCIGKGYNINLGAPVPAASGSAPAPIATASTTASTSAVATGTDITTIRGTVTPVATAPGHISNAAGPVGVPSLINLQMASTVVAVGLATLLVGL
ncbi:hypothetical protein EDD11_001818 [Mortierella claussenii]|nr:hypothetical protein EDD11_001818 [Mortierella claussenii]